MRGRSPARIPTIRRGSSGTARSSPACSSAGGPAGIRGVAPGASILPMRVAGWQPSAEGGFAVYGRTDQLLAGLERAVDPDADGDVLDAARIAVVGVTEPFASFADGPVARAVEGAARLDTLVVVPAGNEGPAGPATAASAGPAGPRPRSPSRRPTCAARRRPCASSSGPGCASSSTASCRSPERRRRASRSALAVARLRRTRAPGRAARRLARFFDDRGYSLVAGKAALLARAAGPTDDARDAVLAGAAAILVDGARPGRRARPRRPPGRARRRPAGAVAASVRGALARGVDVQVSLGAPGWRPNERRAPIAPFSSYGLAFGGGIKPEVAAAGVELVTADPGRNDDRTARYATISGTSAAAALAGGAAAVLAQVRPELDAAALKGALVGTARRSPAAGRRPGRRRARPGRRECRRGGRRPGAVSFGTAEGRAGARRGGSWFANVSSRRVTVRVSAAAEEIAGRLGDGRPDVLRLAPGERRRATLIARMSFVPRRLGAIEGRARLEVSGGGRMFVPWAVALPVRGSALIGGISSRRRFRPSDRSPAVLTVQAGQVRDLAGRRQLRPLSRLDVELWRGGVGSASLRACVTCSRAVRLRAHRPRSARWRARAAAPTGSASSRCRPTGPPRRRSIGFRIR